MSLTLFCSRIARAPVLTLRSSSCSFANDETSWISESSPEVSLLPVTGPWLEFWLVAAIEGAVDMAFCE